MIENDGGDWSIKPGAGGLVTALAPLMRRNQGTWIGWAGAGEDAPVDRLVQTFSEEQEYSLVPVPITNHQVQRYYRGFANQTIWPLFHDMLGYASFDAEDWREYVKVNRQFAIETSEHIDDDSFVWIHDYQLILVGMHLRRLGIQQQLNYFLHIPFPSKDLFRRLPWKNEILYGLLEYDHIGFQTPADERNFIQCVKEMVPEATVRTRQNQAVVRYNGRTIKLGYYPISIDFDEFDSHARSKDVEDAAWFVQENIREQTLVLGLDRLDYSKGIPERFKAFEHLLEKYPELHGKIALVQVVVPSRLNVPEYQGLKEELDTLSGRINSRFSRYGWVPIHYMFRSLDRAQLLGHYRACEIALITPLRDGMNLVAKEFCAASVDDNGVLVLSEFAGAAVQLAKGAILVNPYDLEGTADAIYQAYTMDLEERARRMRLLRNEVRKNSVHKWVSWFLKEEPEWDLIGS